MPDSSRLDALELAVARLTKELVALRTEVRTSRTVASESSITTVISVEVESETLAPASQPNPAEALDTPPRSATSIAAEGERSASGAPTGERAPSGPYISDELRRIAAAADSAAGGGAKERGSPPFADPAQHRQRGRVNPMLFQRENLEALVGRYGTLALAAFTILMGVGAFIGWAIKNGVIGPEMRVALGLVLAIVVGAFGWRLRRGDSPRFGNVLLALSLAIVHVVSWGAGPLLQLVPPAVALGVAALASAGLAVLALRHEDQSLFNVGFGGALLAPFVTSSNTGDAVILLLYGAVVLGAGMQAMRDRTWSKTPFVLGLGIMAYTASGSGQLSSSDVWARAAAPGIFAIASAWLSLILVNGKPRERLAVTALLSAVGALTALHHRDSVAPVRYALAALVTASGFMIATGGGSEFIVRVASTLVLPIAGLVTALVTTGDATSSLGIAISALWAIGSAVAAIANRDRGRDWHAFTATAIGGFAVAMHFERHPLSIIVALAAYGTAAAFVMRQFRLRGVGVATFGWLAIGTAIAFSELGDRTQWVTNPFLTPESGAALAICASWLLFSWHAARTGAPPGEVVSTLPRTVVRLLGALLTFLWINFELAHTVSLDVSTFLLVAYYAVSGVVAIGLGRWRDISLLRQLGLALAVFAAIKAMVETSALSIGWRVGGYLLAGLFLLGVAYWYRATGEGSGKPHPELDQFATDEATR